MLPTASRLQKHTLRRLRQALSTTPPPSLFIAVLSMEQPHKSHRTHKSGASSKKKKPMSSKKNKKGGGDNINDGFDNLSKQQKQQQNPKAFAFNSNARQRDCCLRSGEEP
ncbi:hypothetical protein Leryth_023713 [Lithospermum erythrorhizon]|nr:hypothetical protein Leryth_023713 [Lithospermum erythrorhizon]